MTMDVKSKISGPSVNWRRAFLIPELILVVRSDIYRKLCAKFQASRCPVIGHSSMSIQSVFQGVFKDIFDS